MATFILPVRGSSSYRSILSEAKEGIIIKLKNGVYATPDMLAGRMIDLNSIIPNGVVCLYSAWSYYGMTTQIPDSFYVAIERKRKVRLPKTVDITLVYQKDELLKIGVTNAVINGVKVSIYDRERCVCDAIKYRNKIGLDVMTEILNSYLKCPSKNLTRLSSYAKKLRVFNLLSTFLSVRL